MLHFSHRIQPGLGSRLVDEIQHLSKKGHGLTRIGNLDADVAALKRKTILGESALQTLKVCKLSIREALRPVLLAVLNDTDVDNIATVKKIGHAFDSGIVGQVTEMGGEGRLGREFRSADVIAERVVT